MCIRDRIRPETGCAATGESRFARDRPASLPGSHESFGQAAVSPACAPDFPIARCKELSLIHIYAKTGNLRAVQLLLGHTKIESTVRYLGIEVDDALAIAEQIDV